MEEKIERGVVKFVQKPGTKPKSKKVAKSALVEADVNAKSMVEEGSNAKVKIEPDTNVKSTPANASSNATVEVNLETLILEYIKSEEATPMSG